MAKILEFQLVLPKSIQLSPKLHTQMQAPETALPFILA